MESFGRQVGGSHYKDCVIQPAVYCERNNLSFLESCVVKRVTRHRHSTGKGEEDLHKAIHELELLLELLYDE
ncbi:MAG: hypothetical protein EOO77_19030 [Oxalobacteraceae bacterium]|nr:MAG: hypothetical protein EOO77_19030 [Oxalobacteraceae bacterium]